ncbi:MAG: FeoB-associated Cys-rich membrane protein [Fibrobacteria bacterium]|nr:FeoB-associated Cys-rich membrane protein [Fibrobacteria bacterium]
MIETIILTGILGACAFWVYRYNVKILKKSGSGCGIGCNCSGNQSSCSDDTKQKDI